MKDSLNRSARRKRRHSTAHQKAAIVKAHLVDSVPISQLCDEYQIQAHPVLSVAEATLRERQCCL